MQAVIAQRRDGARHEREEIEFLAKAAADGSVPDYQLSAWLMAAYLNPLDEEETAWLTLAMAESGERLDLTGLPKPWVDKHSTGGVGDKTTLVLLPLLAACGLTMVKMSGRGLGITGGTIDKLESIPGFRTDLNPDEMKAQAAEIGLALTGAGPALAPADKALYALRDATATVRSLPLIVSSILSKKIAGGAETVVLDVKCGSGAFMRTLDEARELAEALISTSRQVGLKTRVAITDMDQPLGSCVGNALEVAEAMAVTGASGELDPVTLRFRRLCVELAAIALEASGKAKDRELGRYMAEDAFATGKVQDQLMNWIITQGGDLDGLSKAWDLTPKPYLHHGDAGWVKRVDAERVGQAVVDLGGGRKRKEDEIDRRVGVTMDVCVGSRIEPGQPLFSVYARTETEADSAAEAIYGSIEVSPEHVPEPPLIIDVF